MNSPKRVLLIGFFLTAAFVTTYVTIRALRTPPLSPAQAAQAREEALITSALESLYLTRDPSTIRSMVDFTVYITLADWNKIQGGYSASRLGMTRDSPVLVVVVRGNDVARNRPGSGREPNMIRNMEFDNFYIALDAATGMVIGGSAFYPGRRLPLYETPTFAGGATAVWVEPEKTAEPGVLPVPPAP